MPHIGHSLSGGDIGLRQRVSLGERTGLHGRGAFDSVTDRVNLATRVSVTNCVDATTRVLETIF